MEIGCATAAGSGPRTYAASGAAGGGSGPNGKVLNCSASSGQKKQLLRIDEILREESVQRRRPVALRLIKMRCHPAWELLPEVHRHVWAPVAVADHPELEVAVGPLLEREQEEALLRHPSGIRKDAVMLQTDMGHLYCVVLGGNAILARRVGGEQGHVLLRNGTVRLK